MVDGRQLLRLQMEAQADQPRDLVGVVAEGREGELVLQRGDHGAQVPATLAFLLEINGGKQNDGLVIRQAKLLAGGVLVAGVEDMLVGAELDGFDPAEGRDRGLEHRGAPTAVGDHLNAARAAEDVAPGLPGAGDQLRRQRGVLGGGRAGLVAAGEVQRARAGIGATAGVQVGVVQEHQHAHAGLAQGRQEPERPARRMEIAHEDDHGIEARDFHDQAGHEIRVGHFAALELVHLADTQPEIGIDGAGGDVGEVDLAGRPGEHAHLDAEGHHGLNLAGLRDAGAVLKGDVVQEEDAFRQVGGAAFVGNGFHRFTPGRPSFSAGTRP